MSKKLKTHVFCGKRYNIKHVPLSALQDKETKRKRDICFGACHGPKEKNKALKVNKSTKEEREKLRIYLHEAAHAFHFEWSEELVDELSQDFASFLNKLGYRQVKKENRFV
jgi:hypothetical protein